MAMLNELLIEYGTNKIPYSLLLETEEWKSKREVIINRDKGECTTCHNRPTSYVIGKHIWLYDYIVGIKQPKQYFLDEMDYYQKLLGDKFVGISAKEDDYEFVPMEETAVIEVDRHYHLQVHHKYYVEGKFPWQYENEALITLCNWCHFELHQSQIIVVYKEINSQLIEREMTPCSRCNGAGFFPEYRHIQAGICFRCNGAKYDEFIIAS